MYFNKNSTASVLKPMEKALMDAVSGEDGILIWRQYGHGLYFNVIIETIQRKSGQIDLLAVWCGLN